MFSEKDELVLSKFLIYINNLAHSTADIMAFGISSSYE